MLGIFSCLRYFYSKYIGNVGEKMGDLLIMQKVLLPSEPVSQHSCTNLPKTDDNDRNTKHLILTYGQWDIPEKIQTGRFEDILFWNSPGVFRFVTLPLEIPEKTIFHPWKFCKIVWHPLETPKSKIKTHLKST